MCELCSTASIDRRSAIVGALAFGLVGPRRVGGGQDDPSVAPDLVPVTDDLDIAPRSAWADAPPKWNIPSEDVRFLLVHHTAGRQPSTVPDVQEELRAIYRFHTGPEKNWPDVAYNFFIDPLGGVWEGRAGSLAGPVRADATGGSQGFAQLVCLLGDFTAVEPTHLALDSLQRTLIWLADRYGIDTDPSAVTEFVSRGSNKWPAGDTVVAPTICGHRDMTYTACPGDTFYPMLMQDVRPRLHAESQLRAATTVAASTTSTSTSVPAAQPTTENAKATSPDEVAVRAPTTAATTSSVPTSMAAATSTTRATTAATSNTESDTGRALLAATGVAGVLGAVLARRSRAARRAGVESSQTDESAGVN